MVIDSVEDVNRGCGSNSRRMDSQHRLSQEGGGACIKRLPFEDLGGGARAPGREKGL